MKNFRLSILSLCLAFCVGCFVMENTFPTIAPGTWRGVLQLVPKKQVENEKGEPCLLYTSPSPRDRTRSRMPSSA